MCAVYIFFPNHREQKIGDHRGWLTTIENEISETITVADQNIREFDEKERGHNSNLSGVVRFHFLHIFLSPV